MPKFDYDLFTIGAGSAGVRASRLAASYGARVAVAEEFRVGGTCVIRGCVPKKLFVYASEFGRMFEDAKGYGWSADEPRFDWRALVAKKDTEIARLNGLYIKNLEKAGAQILDTRAVLKDAHTVHLVKENRDVTAAKILIATGGAPWTDQSIAGHDLAVTSNEAFHLEKFPRRVVIAGGGYIAIEFACIFRGLGADVTLVYRGDTLLRNFDRDISSAVLREMEAMGVRIVLNTVFTRLDDLGGGARRVHLKNVDTIDAELVFWAVGRKPNTAGLGLEALGVRLGAEGEVIVDERSRTNVPHIFAVGDVTDRVQLTPVAIREGAAFAETEFNNNPTSVDYAFIPKAVFAQPPVGTVGLTEDEARMAGPVEIYKTDFRPMKNTMSGARSRTMMKLVVDVKTDRVLGVHIVGEGAPEMIQCLAIAVKAGVTKRQFDDTMALHPTSAEELVLLKSASC